MSKVTFGNFSSVLWRGRPWILPGLMVRSVLIVAAAVVVFWLELQFNVATYAFILPVAVRENAYPSIYWRCQEELAILFLYNQL